MPPIDSNKFFSILFNQNKIITFKSKWVQYTSVLKSNYFNWPFNLRIEIILFTFFSSSFFVYLFIFILFSVLSSAYISIYIETKIEHTFVILHNCVNNKSSSSFGGSFQFFIRSLNWKTIVTMPNKILATYKREFKSSNCGLNHDQVESMVRSQWQSRSKSHYYLAYRVFVAIFTTFVVINSLITHMQQSPLGFFFIYLTHWAIILNMIVGIYGAILVAMWHYHPEYAGKLLLLHIQRSSEIDFANSLNFFFFFCRLQKM